MSDFRADAFRAVESWKDEKPSNSTELAVINHKLLEFDPKALEAARSMVSDDLTGSDAMTTMRSFVSGAMLVTEAFEELYPEGADYEPMWLEVVSNPEGYASVIAEDPAFGIYVLSALRHEGTAGMAAMAMVGEATLTMVYTEALQPTDVVLGELPCLRASRVSAAVEKGGITVKKITEIPRDIRRSMETMLDVEVPDDFEYLVNGRNGGPISIISRERIEFISLNEVLSIRDELLQGEESESSNPFSQADDTDEDETPVQFVNPVDVQSRKRKETEAESNAENKPQNKTYTPDVEPTAVSSDTKIPDTLARFAAGEGVADPDRYLHIGSEFKGTKKSKRAQFVQSIYLAATAARMASGSPIPPEYATVVAVIESGWGESQPHGSNNVFGIKGTNWKGEVVSSLTVEYLDGDRQILEQDFRAYPSLASATADWYNLMSLPRYEGVVGHALTDGDLAEVGTILQEAGYATDPNYGKLWGGVVNGRSFKGIVSDQFVEDVRLASLTHAENIRSTA